MSLGDDDHYNAPARFFHWTVAAIVLCLILVGLYMDSMPYSPEKLQVYSLHKSFGLTVLWLACARLVWRFVSLPPESLETHAAWEQTLAKATHFFLYFVMFAMPLSGWIMSSAGEFPVVFFGINMPDIVDKSEGLFDIMRTVHVCLAYGLIAAIGLHAAGAFKHHFLDRDATLQRMSFSGNALMPVILVLALGGFFAAAGWMIFFKADRSQEPASVTRELTEAEAATLAEADMAEHEWQMLPDQSRLTFEAVMSGSPFTGEFKKFTAKIIFDPANLPYSKASVAIDIASVTTNNGERDKEFLNVDWFAAEVFPEARYETIELVKKGEGNEYIAVGNLTIRDKTMPVTMPFTLDISKDAKGRNMARMEGTMDLNRLDFGVGQGEWENTSTVADAVSVKVSLTAVQP